ncbi:MAG: DNA topoisomerase I [Hadesarchaea archaeon]|nr:MAG: DNA topoisomerase I [Hadesarchaea archaeon]
MEKKNFEVKSLVHRGVMIPTYEPKQLHIFYRGKRMDLTPAQEEMAVAFGRHLLAGRGEDRVFVRNFLSDFCKALGIPKDTDLEHFDFSPVLKWLEEEKRRKESMTKEERKKLAEERKRLREANRERWGVAWVNGEKVEVKNYTVEPPCVFLGRGKHPLRGRWKPRVEYEDIILNLSPDAPMPEAPEGRKWGGREWDPEALWIAKWRDKLTGKMKYVWLSDTFPLKQEREREKFDRAKELGKKIEKVREHIRKNLSHPDLKRRMVATVCYLIDELKLRVGDERDREERNTVGATTLGPQHLKFDGPRVKFSFLGKDHVRWSKSLAPIPEVLRNLKEFAGMGGERIFPGISSEDVNSFLGEAMPGLTAKVFRTYHASRVVEEELKKSGVGKESTEMEKKYAAKMANLRAAEELNHKRKIPAGWRKKIERMKERIKQLEQKMEELKSQKGKRKEERMRRLKERIRELKLRLELEREIRDFNLGTSLNSYIDPRIYVLWAKKVGYGVEKIYSKSLRKKFSWAIGDGLSP